jgi:hypothetical protein
MPNIDEMRWNVYAYRAYGFKALSWFNLVCPGKSDTEGECFRESVIYRDGTIKDKQLFKDFGKLNNEVHGLGDTLMKLDTVHAYHTKNGIAGVELLPTDWMITPVGDADFVISHMVTKKGDETYVMLFNKSWEHPATAEFAISPVSGITGLGYVSPWGGNEYPVAIRDGRFTETFRPGEGKLYRLVGELSRRVLPIGRNPARLNLELSEPAELMGLDVTFSADTVVKAAHFQTTTNKRFPEEKTLSIPFAAEGDGQLSHTQRIRFEPYMGKYVRYTVNDEDSWNNFGYAELRIRFAGEADEESAATAGVAEAVIYEDLDFTALDTATTAFEALDETAYTPETWREAKNFYEAAVAMRDCTYPQNAVTVAAWKLEDSIKALVPAEECFPAAEAAHPAKEKKPLRMAKGILPALIAAAAGAAAGLAVGILKALGNRKK